jgi:hypothetical protein
MHHKRKKQAKKKKQKTEILFFEETWPQNETKNQHFLLLRHGVSKSIEKLRK